MPINDVFQKLTTYFFALKTHSEQLLNINFNSILAKSKDEAVKILLKFVESLSALRSSVSSLESFKDKETLVSSIIATLVFLYALYTLFIASNRTICIFPSLSFIICCMLHQYNQVIHQKTEFIYDALLKPESTLKLLIVKLNASTVLLTVILYMLMVYFYYVVRLFIFSIMILYTMSWVVPEDTNYTVICVSVIIISLIFYKLFRLVERIVFSAVMCAVGSTLLILFLTLFNFYKEKVGMFLTKSIFNMKIDVNDHLTIIWILLYSIGMISHLSTIYPRKK